ncbi:MAG: aconitate hydratase AcnA [Deltaproteobacteria bacterium]|nr:aconitate hydratase AcnA [Deltaproteobacteria bacterium]
MGESRDAFGALRELDCEAGRVAYYSLPALEDCGLDIHRLPYCIRVLLESALRRGDEPGVEAITGWGPDTAGEVEIAFAPARVLLQDFTGVPSLVDLAALRSAALRLGGDPARIEPRLPVDLVVDHSVAVDRFGTPDALRANAERELARNRERYAFLKWGQQAFERLRIMPPGTGIIHQVNLEYLAEVVACRDGCAFCDSVVGTDSHTPMCNGLGVLGWGVGGIEAEAVMLGQPISMRLPEVVGLELTGELPAGCTATDLVLHITELLRAQGVVGRFVEYFGPGTRGLSLADRALVANMSPEQGCTVGFWPVDAQTLDYLRLTGRSREQLDLVERYCEVQGLLRKDASPTPRYSQRLGLDLGEVEPSLAGPKRPQDRLALKDAAASWRRMLRAPAGPKGIGLAEEAIDARAECALGEERFSLGHGAVVIAAICSCTNTSNPALMLAAGLLARKAVERGLEVKPWVKTSLAPGSRVVTRYLETSGLLAYLERLGFHVVGYGCTTCIGNSGPLPGPVAEAIEQGGLVAAAVLSGNRNFEGRIHPLTRANFLASPPLVVAYALAGSLDADLTREPVGRAADGSPVMLTDIWPGREELDALLARCLRPEDFESAYAEALAGSAGFDAISAPRGALWDWSAAQSYIREPPFFVELGLQPPPIAPILGARALAVLPDSTTTDHISPAGPIAAGSPAARYLESLGVPPADFNTYGSRRGNHEVMMRGSFANIRIHNALVPGIEGGLTEHLPSGERMSIFDAAERYRADGTPLVILAGAEYGTGSSRDWAAKGPALLGVRAVVAQSFERIHRSNLVGMGVLPLQLAPGQSMASLGLSGRERYSLPELGDDLRPGQTLELHVEAEGGKTRTIALRCRIDTPAELAWYRHGGILNMALRELLAG